MATRRIQRLNEQIRQDLAELISRELKDPRLTGLVSITSVELSPDLRYAQVFVSVLGSADDRKRSLAALRSAAGFLRTQIAARMTTKRAPELHFVADQSIEQGERIMHLLREVEPPLSGEAKSENPDGTEES
jgi:ribosome-binding factor A